MKHFHAFRFSPRPNRAAAIQWQEWGDAAFRLAQADQKPILLAISAVWCHWCHVMDETTYSDQRVIDTINRDFVPIRVDSDRRPDVDRRYNQGGWPTVAFLAPTGELLWGATYLPPDQMCTALRQVADHYRANQAAIAAQINAIRQAPSPPAAPRGALDRGEHVTAGVRDALRDNFDDVAGGFGTAPKFPHLDALRFLLEHYYFSGDADLGRMLRLTLDGMQAGAIFDRVAGGFFRYATTREWGTPHYEKMLADNAAFLRLYLEAAQVFSDGTYRETALRVGEYPLDTLYNPALGVFYGSQDADEDYYALDKAGRLQRVAPFVDPTVYVDQNAQAAMAYAAAYRLLGEARFRQIALRAVDFLQEHCYHPDRGMYHYWDGRPHLAGLLADQVAMLLALLDAHEISGNPSYLSNAEALAALVQAEYPAEGGGFGDLARHDVVRLGLLRLTERNLEGNALAAEGFARLALMTGDDGYRVAADETLRAFSIEGPRQSIFAAGYARVVAAFLRAPVHLVVVGDRRDARTADLFWEAVRVFIPGKVAQLVEPDSPRLPALGYPPSPVPVVYVCQDYTCLPPIADPKAVAPAVRRG